LALGPRNRSRFASWRGRFIFGGWHAAAHPELVIAAMNAASSDWASKD
jgi:hypothetical protein